MVDVLSRLDHIVYVVTDLDAAIGNFQTDLGIVPVFGGYHNSFGTKNALIQLQDQLYLELLAVDDTNKSVSSPRWMGVDLVRQNKITRWACHSAQIKEDAGYLKAYDAQMGTITGGSRNTPSGSLLQWTLTLPLPLPEVELLPFAIDWSKSECHPTEQLPKSGCKLIEFNATHPNPELFSNIFERLGITFKIDTKEEISLKARFKGPNGIFEL